MKRIKFAAMLLMLSLLVGGYDQLIIARQTTSAKPVLHWYKGNTHTHTLNSDGDSAPADVVRWYREHKYNFLVLTDHNFLTHVDVLNGLYGAEGQFIVIKGDEVSDRFGDKPIHVNALNPDKNVLPRGGTSIVNTIQNNVDAIRAVNGVPHINHPNFLWAITADDLKQINNCMLFEVFSGHPYINNYGAGGMPGVEEIWDDVLSDGKIIYGIAVDDAHCFKEPWNRKDARPGQGWVMVRAEELTASSILKAMERGDFYATTGIVLKDYQADDKGIRIKYKETETFKYTVQFIGNGGKVFAEVYTNPATYTFRGNEKYIRARIMDSSGNVAWTQPVRVGKK